MLNKPFIYSNSDGNCDEWWYNNWSNELKRYTTYPGQMWELSSILKYATPGVSATGERIVLILGCKYLAAETESQAADGGGGWFNISTTSYRNSHQRRPKFLDPAWTGHTRAVIRPNHFYPTRTPCRVEWR